MHAVSVNLTFNADETLYTRDKTFMARSPKAANEAARKWAESQLRDNIWPVNAAKLTHNHGQKFLWSVAKYPGSIHIHFTPDNVEDWFRDVLRGFYAYG